MFDGISWGVDTHIFFFNDITYIYFFTFTQLPKQARLQATEADEQIESLEHELKRIKDLEQHKEQQQNDKYQKIYQERHQEQEEELKNNKLEMEKQKDELMQLKNQANEASQFAKDESRKVYIGRKFRKHAGKVVSATHQPNKTDIVKRKKRFSAILNEITLEGDSTNALVMEAEQTIIVGGMKNKTFSHHAMHPRQKTTPVPSVFADDDLDLMLPVSKIDSNKNIVSSKSNKKDKTTSFFKNPLKALNKSNKAKLELGKDVEEGIFKNPLKLDERYGTINHLYMAASKLLLFTSEGNLMFFNPNSGKLSFSTKLANSMSENSPMFADGSLYFFDNKTRLYQYE